MSIGVWQLVLILLIVLVIFGAGKLPKVMGELGKGVKNLRSELKNEGEAVSEPKPKATAKKASKSPAKKKPAATKKKAAPKKKTTTK